MKQEFQLPLRAQTPETEVFGVISMNRELDPNGNIYAVPSTGVYELAADTLPDSSFNQLDFTQGEIGRHAVGVALLGVREYWQTRIVAHAARMERPKLVIPTDSDYRDVIDLQRDRISESRSKLAASTAGIIPVFMAVDFGPSVASTPPFTETILGTGVTMANAARIDRDMRRGLKALSGDIEIIESDELAVLADMDVYVPSKKLKYLDEVDGDERPGYTEDRQNQAEVLTFAFHKRDEATRQRASRVFTEATILSHAVVVHSGQHTLPSHLSDAIHAVSHLT